MKKFVLVLAVLVVIGVMMTSVGFANEDPIWNDVWSFWKRLSSDEYDRFITTEYDSNGFVSDGIAYYASSNSSLYYDEYHSLSEIETYFNEASKSGGRRHFPTHVGYIGRDDYGRNIVKLTLRTAEDLRQYDKTNMKTFDEPVYGLELICWDRICIPTEER